MSDKEIQQNFSFVNSVRESTPIRLSLLFGGFFVCLIVNSLIVAMLNGLPGDERDHLLWGSILQNLLVFCLPAFLLAKFCSPTPLRWLKLDTKIKLKPIAGVLIVYLISLPAMDWITEWNSQLTLPEALSGLETTLRMWEEQGNETGQLLIGSTGVISILVSILVVGIITGFSEELFFRSGVQGILIRSGLGKTGAVWLAATIFSALHFQFFGFIPRLLMGVFFGYLLVWSNDVKVSAFAHILNNSMVIVFASIYGAEILTDNNISIYPDVPYLPMVSLILTAIFLIFCRGYFFKDHKTLTIPWQKRAVVPPSGN